MSAALPILLLLPLTPPRSMWMPSPEARDDAVLLLEV
jgi:hypothetical protein